MVINWHGYSCFRIEVTGPSGKVAIVTDPYSPEGRVRLPRSIAADIVTVSHGHERHNNVKDVGGDPFVIDGPGEYEVKDVSVTGVAAFHDLDGGKKMGGNNIYYFIAEGMHVAHLGDLKHPLAQDQLGDIHNVDILLLPVGGKDVLDAKQAADVVAQFEPRVIVPMHYRTDRHGKELDGVEPFLKAMGVSEPEEVSKLKLLPKDLPQEDTRIVVIQPQ